MELDGAVTTVDDLVAGNTTITGGGGTQITFENLNVYVRPQFIEYLRSGWAISLVAAIDYTASNGEPSNPRSLHYLGQHNQYESALGNVG